MYKRISDYGIVGNLRTAALVASDGSIDWLCYPHLDSPALFAKVLDHEQGGCLAISPHPSPAPVDAVQRYQAGSNILITRLRTRQGILRITDFMAVPRCGPEAADSGSCEGTVLHRKVELETGAMDVRVLFAPRFDYARADVELEALPGGVLAKGAGQEIALTATMPLERDADKATALWRMQAGETAWLRLGASAPEGKCSREDKVCVTSEAGEKALQETAGYWKEWLERSETGCTFRFGEYKNMVERSALVLKLLHYDPSGAMAAAATTSLPEEIGGVRNWDYRYTWIRDASFTLQALYDLGHMSETEGYLRWLESVLEKGGVVEMQIMYGLRGERDLPEQELPHLDGYKGSRPVRIGNEAASQRQLDIYGELLDAVLRLANYVGKIREEHWPVLREICDHVAGHWQEPDAGIWEVRGGPFHFVYSKVMCWVTLDRGLTIAERFGFPCDAEAWQRTKEDIMTEVLDKGYDTQQGTFVQHYGTRALDASNLLLPIMGFLPFDDHRVVGTIEATQRELSHDGLLYRYKTEDGLEGDEGVFLFCSFWLAHCLIGLGRLREAETLLRRLERTANHLGLFAEEYDPQWKEPLGNFPQAFTHIGYVTSVMRLLRAREEHFAAQRGAAAAAEESSSMQRLGEFVRKKLLAREIVLNEGTPTRQTPAEHVAAELKQTMNLLRGAFFDSQAGRVAYENMAGSELYETYVAISRNLQHFDPGKLATSAERKAFWVNLYNVMIIHGVVALQIRDSVKEVRSFFTRIKYNVGGQLYAPEDVEHGILRANRKPPHSLRRRFGDDDPRLSQALTPEDFDPRVHFALVCASSSCPPIGLYTAENLDHELSVAGRSFCNAGGVKVDCVSRKATLSRIFQWYDEDFGEDVPARLHYLAAFLFNPEERRCLQEQAQSMRVVYQEYDWRLNRK